MSANRGQPYKEDFGTKFRRWKRNALWPPPGKEPWLKDLIMFIGHLAFYPMSYLTLVLQPHVYTTTFGWNPAIAAVLWTGLIASAYLVLAGAREACPGPLTSLGGILIMLGFACLVPMIFGFAAFSATVFLMGGFHGLWVISKGILFFGFLWYYFTVTTDRR